MPYRRLPKTDQARIRSLKAIVDKSEAKIGEENPVSLNVVYKARNLLSRMEPAQIHYKQCYDAQSISSKKHQQNVKKARMYVSHFIQVFNMSVMRGEIKSVMKEMYGLPKENILPDLISEANLIEWGKKVVDGEQRRIAQGGIALHNPTISKVKVYYDIFVESHERQKNSQKITARSLDSISQMREEADDIILEAWNQIEKHFEVIPSAEKRLDKCREYGVIYYYRKGETEKKLTE